MLYDGLATCCVLYDGLVTYCVLYDGLVTYCVLYDGLATCYAQYRLKVTKRRRDNDAATSWQVFLISYSWISLEIFLW